MTNYIIIELADGLAAVELPSDRNPADVAAAEGGLLIDEGPFGTMEEATDAIDALEAEVEDEKRV
jgi:hypothetical protein